MAAALKKEAGVAVEVIDGSPGELTVTVDGRTVAKKGADLPAVEEVLAAVRKEMAGATP